MMRAMPDLASHYDTLQVARNAGPEVIRGAYRYLTQKWHPDKNTDRPEEAEQKIRIINEAYRVLSDPVLRREHDLWIDRRRSERRAAQQTPPSSPPAWTQPPQPTLPESARRMMVDSLSARHTWWILPGTGLAILWAAANTLGPSLWNLVWGLIGGGAISYLCARLFGLDIGRQDDTELQRRYVRHGGRTRLIAVAALLAVGLAYSGHRQGSEGSQLFASLLMPWLSEASADTDRRRLRPPCATDGGSVANGVRPGTAASLRPTTVALPPDCSY